MSNHVAHFLRIRPSLLHTLLGPAHFTGRDHFHRFGDLLSILDTLDLGPNFFSASHFLLSCRNLHGLVRLPATVGLKVLQRRVKFVSDVIVIGLVAIQRID